jgi:hypothetical protein
MRGELYLVNVKEHRRLVMRLLLLCILAILGFYISPKQINLTYDAIEYRVGNPNIEKHIKVNLKGIYYNKILSKDTFEGSITIKDKELKKVQLVIGIENTIFDGVNEELGNGVGYGIFFATNRFKKLTIGLIEKNGWDNNNGLMVSAPSKSRVEALNISNNLMNGFLKRALN